MIERAISRKDCIEPRLTERQRYSPATILVGFARWVDVAQAGKVVVASDGMVPD